MKLDMPEIEDFNDDTANRARIVFNSR